MTNKKTLKFILTAVVMLAVVFTAIALCGTLDTAAAEGAKTPIYDASSSDIYAQGTHIYIVDGTNGGTAVYYLSGSSKVYVNPNGAAGDDLSGFTILGGGDGYVLEGDVRITMTGGQVLQITCTGGGATVADQSLGDVNGNVYVTISGGTVTRRLTASWYNPVRGNVEFTITGGTVGNVYAYVERSNYGYPDCRVHGNSTVTITNDARITGEVGLGDGNYPVSGAATIVSTVPVTLEDSTTLASTEGNIDNFLYKNGSTWKVKGNVTLPEGATLAINTGETLSIPSSATLTNNGEIVNIGASDIKGAVINNGTALCSTHNYSYECDTTCNLCGTTRDASCEAGTGKVSGSTITVPCKYCGETVGTVTLNDTTVTYNGTSKNIGVTGTGIYVGKSFTISYTKADDASFSGTPKLPGTYTATITVAGASASATLTIEKSDLEVKSAPTVYHIYGEDSDTKDIHATIVLAGTDTVVSGTWTREWRGMYLMAKFTPTGEHAAHVNDLEHQKITYNMTAATPVITISSPSPAIMPGMKIKLNVTVENPHATFNVIMPTKYTVTYKVGANGTPVTVEGTEFTLPMDAAALGDTIYVTVKSLAHLSYYTEGTSNTVEIFVGQLDYTEDINDLQDQVDSVISDLDIAVRALEQADLDNADALAEAITNLNQAIAQAQQVAQSAAEATARAEDAALEAELVQKIEDLNTALTNKIDDADAVLQNNIDEVQKNLDDAIAALEAADQKNADDLAQAIIDLTDAIGVAQAAAEAYAKAGDDALNAALTKKIDDADAVLQNNIDEVQKNLNEAVAALEAADKENAAALAQAIVDLTDAIGVAQAAAEAYAKAGDDALNAALTKKIDDADAVLQSNIDKLAEHLNVQVERLDKADAENAEALRKAIEDLTATIKAAQAIAQATAKLGDKELKAELTDKIELADKALAEAIEALQLSLDETNATVDGVIADLDKAVEELEKAIDEGETKLESKITNLDDALKAAQAGLVAADAGVKAELAGKIDNAKKLLSETIDALQKKLDETKAALDATDVALAKADADNKAAAEAADAALAAADAVLEAKDKKLTATSVVAVVLGSIALLGNGGLLAWILIDKKKLIKK